MRPLVPSPLWWVSLSLVYQQGPGALKACASAPRSHGYWVCMSWGWGGQDFIYMVNTGPTPTVASHKCRQRDLERPGLWSCLTLLSNLIPWHRWQSPGLWAKPRQFTHPECLLSLHCSDACSFLLAQPSVKETPWDFPCSPVVENIPANAGDVSLIPSPGRFHMTWGN